ncbi:MAG: class I SAM-dependent methyltransferase, partial [Hoylesella saccharolytica]
PDALETSAVEIRWGISDGHVVETWVPNIRLIEQESYMNFCRPRWGLMGYTIGLSNKIAFKFSSLLQFEVLKG